MPNANFTSVDNIKSIKDVTKLEAIHYTRDFENLLARFDSFQKFYNTGKRKK